MATAVQPVGRAAPRPEGTAPAAVQRRGRANLSLVRSTPGRLWLIMLGSVAVCLLWGAVATWSAAQWTSAANQIVSSTGPLSYDAQQAYRSLSDADATEANAYLSGIAS